jgi:hypothetical protein
VVIEVNEREVDHVSLSNGFDSQGGILLHGFVAEQLADLFIGLEGDFSGLVAQLVREHRLLEADGAFRKRLGWFVLIPIVQSRLSCILPRTEHI